VYFHTSKSYKGALSRFDWNRVSSALLPNYFGAVQPMGPVKVGFSYAVPDSSQEDQDQTFSDVSVFTKQYVINFHANDTTYNFGPTIAAPITNDLSVGMTLYYYLRRFSYILNEVNTYNTSTPTYGWTNRIFDLVEKGLRPVIGVMWLPMEKFSLGLSLSKVYLLDSAATQQDSCSDTNIDGIGCDTPFTMTSTTVKDERKFPTHAAIGAAYYVSPDLLVSGDLNYYTKVIDLVGGNQPQLANLAVGAEYSLTNIWTVRGGVFTDLANTPNVVATGTQQLEHVDLYGASMSVRHSKSKTTSVTLGGSYADGTGKAQIRGGSNDIQTVKLTEWTVFLSSSYAY
jgi:long-chain fatty acid transport protein